MGWFELWTLNSLQTCVCIHDKLCPLHCADWVQLIVHSLCLVYFWPLTFAWLKRCLLYWWKRHSVWWCPQTSCCGQGVLSLPLCCFMPTSLHVYDCCFQVAFLEGPLLGTSEDVKPLQCWRYWSVKKLGVYQTPHECCGSCHLLPFTAVVWPAVVTHTLHVGTAVLHHVAGGRERVCTEQ